jgi:hypothetical protein
MDADHLVNTLRRAVGQVELAPETAPQVDLEIPASPDDPAWINTEPQFVVNGTDLLHHGEVPLGRVNELLEKLDPGKCILLFTNFEPSPIMDAMQKQNRLVFHKVHPNHPDQHMTYIQ